MSESGKETLMLTVLGGSLAGTKVELKGPGDEISIGSHPDCRFQLNVFGISLQHALLRVTEDGATIVDRGSPRGTYINDDRVMGEAHVNHGDCLWLGPPGDKHSVMIHCRLPIPPPTVNTTVAAVHLAAADQAEAPAVESAVQHLVEGEFVFEAAPPESAADVMPVPPIQDEPVIAVPETDAVAAPAVEEFFYDDGGAVPAQAVEMTRLTPESDSYSAATSEAPPFEVQFEGFTVEEENPAATEMMTAPPPVPAVTPDENFYSDMTADVAPMAVPEVEGAVSYDNFYSDAGVGASEEPTAPVASANVSYDNFYAEVTPEAAEPAEPLSIPAATYDNYFAEAAPVPVEGALPAEVGGASFEDFYANASPAGPTEIEPAPQPETVVNGSFDSVYEVEKQGASAADAAPTAAAAPEHFGSSPAATTDFAFAVPSNGAEEFFDVTSENSELPPEPPAAAPVVAAPLPPAPQAETIAPPQPVGEPAAPPRRAAVSPAPSPVRSAAPQRRPAPTREPRAGAVPQRQASSAKLWLMIAGGIALVALAGGGLAGYWWWSQPTVRTVSPTRVRKGDKLAISGRNLGTAASGTRVLIGDQTAVILQSQPEQVTVEVPSLPVVTGRDVAMPVRVRVGNRESRPVMVGVFESPEIHGLSPDVALPGEEVVLMGKGWAPGAVVRFGEHNAEVVSVTAQAITVRVPQMTANTGTEWPVSVMMGVSASNSVTFILGRPPLVLSIEPPQVSPGDVVKIVGRGFAQRSLDNMVSIAGRPAALLSTSATELKAIVPRQPQAGAVDLEIRVSGRESPALAKLTINPLPDPIDFHFVVEPYLDGAGHEHAFVCSELGPIFVFSDSGGRSAATRALDATSRLHAAAKWLKASLERDFEARDLSTDPSVGLTGQTEPVLAISDEDVSAYNEDWTDLRGRGGVVTRARLALWWANIARDHVLLLIRSEKPVHAAALAPEGRVLADWFQAARKASGFGVPRSVVASAKGPLVDGLRTLALRVPPSVIIKDDQTAAAASVGALKLDGTWGGTLTEEGRQRSITVVFSGKSGTFSLEGAVTLTVPIQELSQPRRDSVRFATRMGGGMRYFQGIWDGKRIAGTIAKQSSGAGTVGSFELKQ
jgi:hypothetical protein